MRAFAAVLVFFLTYQAVKAHFAGNPIAAVLFTISAVCMTMTALFWETRAPEGLAMTPGERLVLAMAEKYVAAPADPQRATDLIHAVELLQSERAGRTPEQLKELDLTYGQLTTGDGLQSANGRWYEVRTTNTDPKTGNVKVWLKDVPKPVQRQAAHPARVRRGEMGAAVDLFATVLFSGRTAPDAPDEVTE